jgi:SNF2 family DNA or RNA helicase
MIPLLAPQTQAIDRLKRLKVGALFMRPGVGKTRPTVELVNSVPGMEHVIHLAPYQSVYPPIQGTGIQDEVAKWGGYNVPVDFFGIESLSSSDRIFLQLLKLVQSKTTFLIVDESLKIKNWDAIRTKRIIELGRHCEYKMILNGTPISRNLLDLWAQMEFLSPMILHMSQSEYKSTFCETVKITKYKGNRIVSQREFISKYHNIDYLYSVISPYIYEADLHLDIAEQDIDLEYKLDDEIKQEYERLKELYLDNEMLQRMNNNIFLEMTQKMQHLYCCAEDKFTVVKKLLGTIDPERTIIFCKFIASQDACKKAFPKCQVLSLQANSYSLNLQHYHNTIYWDHTWDWAVVDQSRHRTRRTGQQNALCFYRLNGPKLDLLMAANNEKKQGMLQYLKHKTVTQIKTEV